jgi:hypothetical protein
MHEARVRPGGQIRIAAVINDLGAAVGRAFLGPTPTRIYHVFGVVVNLTAGGGAGNRTLALKVLTDNGATVAWHSAVSGNVAATQTFLGAYAPNLTYSAAVTRRLATGVAPNVQVDDCMPDLWLSGTSSIMIYDTANIATTDGFTALIFYEEFHA